MMAFRGFGKRLAEFMQAGMGRSSTCIAAGLNWTGAASWQTGVHSCPQTDGDGDADADGATENADW